MSSTVVIHTRSSGPVRIERDYDADFAFEVSAGGALTISSRETEHFNAGTDGIFAAGEWLYVEAL